MENNLLELKNLYVNAENKEILKGINLKINKGEIHVIMGPNGSGKTTTANAILNNPSYKKTSGEVIFLGENINNLKTDEIARKGVFMSFQLPEEIPGISVTNFLKYAKGKVTGKPVKIFEFKDELKKYVKFFVDGLPDKFRNIIILREVEDLSYEEIAEMLNIPLGTIRSRLFNARQIIKERLIKQGLIDNAFAEAK